MPFVTLTNVNQSRNLLIEEDNNTLRESIASMLEALESKIDSSLDELLRDPIPLSSTGRQQPLGRSRIEIDKNWLAHASQGMTLKRIAKEVGCSARTVRRRLLDNELATPAPPVIQTFVQQDGSVTKEWHPTGPTRFDLRNEPERLDDLVKVILDQFKNYSLESVKASLRNQGYRVPRNRIQSSLTRVRGVQPRFVNRPIERRVYSVPEVNSLWHHDGNHSKRILRS